LAQTLLAQGKLDEAATRYEHALALNPNLVEALNDLGILLGKLGRPDASIERFQEALALRPDYVEAHNNLGIVLAKQDRLDEAAAHFEQAIYAKSDYAEAYNNLASVLWKQEKLDPAVARFEQAVACRPDYVDALTNLGGVLKDLGRFDLARQRLERAIALRPDHAEAYHSLGNVLLNECQFAEAAARYRQTLALAPQHVDAHVNLATIHLVAGDYPQGLPLYEWRLLAPGFSPPAHTPRWAGEPLAGRSLLLVAEQGLGDTIQFLRYARVFKQLGARVVLAVQGALVRLLTGHPDIDELVALGPLDALPQIDFYLPLLSAAAALSTTVDTIPRHVPYLWADRGLAEHWHQELAGIEGMRIGIVWQGARRYLFDRWRSIPLAAFGPLARVPGVRLISLQKGEGAEQAAQVDFPLLDLSDRLDATSGAFLDTAAVIANLDLVIAPNSAVAHLAGALGAPVWLALPSWPEWRWLEGRDDSPWYPTMRLFRQTEFGRWDDVFERMAAAVEARKAKSLSAVAADVPAAVPDAVPTMASEAPPVEASPEPAAAAPSATDDVPALAELTPHTIAAEPSPPPVAEPAAWEFISQPVAEFVPQAAPELMQQPAADASVPVADFSMLADELVVADENQHWTAAEGTIETPAESNSAPVAEVLAEAVTIFDSPPTAESVSDPSPEPPLPQLAASAAEPGAELSQEPVVDPAPPATIDEPAVPLAAEVAPLLAAEAAPPAAPAPPAMNLAVNISVTPAGKTAIEPPARPVPRREPPRESMDTFRLDTD